MKTFMKKMKSKIYKKRQPIITTMLLTLVLMSYQNCQQQEFYEKENLSEVANPADVASTTEGPTIVDFPPVAPSEPVSAAPVCADGVSTHNLICNPFGDGEKDPENPMANPRNNRQGLIASLYEGVPDWGDLDMYYAQGYKHPESIFFQNFNIGTRSFSDGFDLSNGQFLKNKNGEKLIEWFSIEARGFISLPENEEEGYYQIMTLSDDGIEVNINGSTILENKNIHSPTIDCAKKLVHLKKGEEQDFRLRYFQGPRVEIALMTFIKKIDSTKLVNANEAKCPSVQSVEGLRKKGYKVIRPEWFTLPKDF